MTGLSSGAARAGWALTAFTAVCAVLDTVVTIASSPSLLSEETVGRHGWPITPVASVGCSVVGALILARFPRHPIGWVLCVMGAITSFGNVAEAYSVWVHRYAGPGSEWAWQFSGWLSVLSGGTLGLSALGTVFFLAPDGRLLSRRWWPAFGVLVLGQLVFTAAVLTVPLRLAEVDVDIDYGQPTESLAQTGLLLVALGLVGAAVSMVVRMRRAHGEVRLQLRWFASAAVVLALGVVNLIVVEAGNGDRQTMAASLPLFFSLLAFPVFVGIAVLRHRLYDIDLILSRAALLTLATAAVAVGYVVVVVIVAGTASGGSVWTSLLATVVVALAFQPLRASVLRFAHRVAYGRRAAPYEALADLSRRLGESPDPEQLLPAAAETAARAVAAAQATVTLEVPGTPDVTATWPPQPGDPSAPAAPDGDRTTVLPIAEDGEALGYLALTLPPGRSLRPADRQLLAKLGDQTALALRNARLAAELAARVAQLDARSRELAGSRARLIAARDAERDRLEATIRTDVLSHLESLPERLHGLAAVSSRVRRRTELGALAERITTALEELRTISHGIYPAQLERLGLASVLSRQGSGPGTVAVDDTVRGRRFESRIEATTYFCFTETLRALTPPVHAWLGVRDDQLVLEMSGTGRGAGRWAEVRDRVESVGGAITWRAAADRSVVAVRIAVQVPVGAGRP